MALIGDVASSLEQEGSRMRKIVRKSSAILLAASALAMSFAPVASADRHDGGNPGGSNKHCKSHCH